MQFTHTLALIIAAAGITGARNVPVRAPATHQITMIAEGTSYRFEPATTTIKQGDVVRFVMASGGPHNVSFDGDKLSAAAKATLAANMPDQIQPLAGKLLMSAGESYTVSFAGVAPGVYPYFCMPHMAMGMQGTITVE